MEYTRSCAFLGWYLHNQNVFVNFMAEIENSFRIVLSVAVQTERRWFELHGDGFGNWKLSEITIWPLSGCFRSGTIHTRLAIVLDE